MISAHHDDVSEDTVYQQSKQSPSVCFSKTYPCCIVTNTKEKQTKSDLSVLMTDFSIFHLSRGHREDLHLLSWGGISTSSMGTNGHYLYNEVNHVSAQHNNSKLNFNAVTPPVSPPTELTCLQLANTGNLLGAPLWVREGKSSIPTRGHHFPYDFFFFFSNKCTMQQTFVSVYFTVKTEIENFFFTT